MIFSGNPCVNYCPTALTWTTLPVNKGSYCSLLPIVQYLMSFRPKYCWCCFPHQINNNRTICWTNERSPKESCRVISKAPVMRLQLWLQMQPLDPLTCNTTTSVLDSAAVIRMDVSARLDGWNVRTFQLGLLSQKEFTSSKWFSDRFYFAFRFSLGYGTRSAFSFSCIITVRTSVSFLSYIFPLLHIPCRVHETLAEKMNITVQFDMHWGC